MIRVLESLLVVGAALSCVLFFTSGNLVGTGSDFDGFEGEILELHVQVTNLQSARAHEIMTMATLKRNQAHLTTKIGELRKDLAVAQRVADDWEYLFQKMRRDAGGSAPLDSTIRASILDASEVGDSVRDAPGDEFIKARYGDLL